MELSTQFHYNASVTAPRLSALIDNYKSASEATGNSPSISTNDGGQNSSKLKLPELQVLSLYWFLYGLDELCRSFQSIWRLQQPFIEL